MSQELEALLASWDVATASVDAREREDPLLFASPLEICASHRTKQLPKNKSKASLPLSRPWDHADFLARVRSFSVASWFAKPDVINAFECARYGWRNARPDELHCICCKQTLCFKIDDRLSDAGALNVAKIFAQQLITGHTHLCPWRGNPSPKAFTLLPIATRRQVYDMFVGRLEKLVVQMLENAELLKLLRNFNLSSAVAVKIFNELAACQDIKCTLTTATFASKLSAILYQQKDTFVDPEALVTAAFLVGCGWQFDENSNQFDMLWCSSCNRHWQAIPMITSSQNTQETTEPQPKRLRTDSLRAVDLLSQHRTFCPWIADQKSAGVDDYGEIDPNLWNFVTLPGWRQYAQCLVFLDKPKNGFVTAESSSSASEIKPSDPVEALQSVRAVLSL